MARTEHPRREPAPSVAHRHPASMEVHHDRYTRRRRVRALVCWHIHVDEAFLVPERLVREGDGLRAPDFLPTVDDVGCSPTNPDIDIVSDLCNGSCNALEKCWIHE